MTTFSDPVLLYQIPEDLHEIILLQFGSRCDHETHVILFRTRRDAPERTFERVSPAPFSPTTNNISRLHIFSNHAVSIIQGH